MTTTNMINILFEVDERVAELSGEPAGQGRRASDVKTTVLRIMANVDRDPELAAASLSELNSVVAQASAALLTNDAGVRPGIPERDDRAKGGRSASTTGSAQNVETSRSIVSVDGHDRDVDAFPHRYAFTIRLSEPLRAIKTVSVASVVIPLQDHTINCPHLFASFDQFVGAYEHNQESRVREAFSKLLLQTTYASGKGRTYAVFAPVCDDSKHFRPALASVDRLGIRITRPDGSLVSPARDDVKACKLVQSSDGNWIVVTQSFWHPREFSPGDIVKFGPVDTGVRALDEYLGRSDGHEVVEIGMPDAIDGCNKFLIRRAGVISTDNGAYEPDPMVAEAFDGTHELSDAVGEINVHTSILNVSVQVSATVCADCTTSHRHASELADGHATDLGTYL